MSYLVKEIFYTLQERGTFHCRDGRRSSADSPAATCGPATSGTGPSPYASSATPISWALTALGAAGSPTATALARAVRAAWPARRPRRRAEPFVVCTGGEPLLQLDERAVAALHRMRVSPIAMPRPMQDPAGALAAEVLLRLDHCSQPEGAGAPLVLGTHAATKCKLVFTRRTAPSPEDFGVPRLPTASSLQPMDGPDRAVNTEKAVQYCLAHPQWRLSLQTHKYLGIP